MGGFGFGEDGCELWGKKDLGGELGECVDWGLECWAGYLWRY